MYRSIAKNNQDTHCTSVVSSIQNILMSFILNYRKNCKSNNASRDIFTYRYTSLIIINCKYVFAIKKIKRI